MPDTFSIEDFLADTFARNKALYGGWTMELEDGEAPEAGESGEDGEQSTDTDEAGTEDTDKGAENIPTDVLRKKLTEANSEAASYRTKLREVEKLLSERKSPDEVEELVAQLRTERESAERALIVENVALKYELPQELADVLKGGTREELEEHAKALQKFANPAPANEPRGGLNPSDEPDEAGDPMDRVRAIRGRRI